MAISPNEKTRIKAFGTKVAGWSTSAGIGGIIAGQGVGGIGGGITGALIGAGVGAGSAVAAQAIEAKKNRNLGRQFK